MSSALQANKLSYNGRFLGPVHKQGRIKGGGLLVQHEVSYKQDWLALLWIMTDFHGIFP